VVRRTCYNLVQREEGFGQTAAAAAATATTATASRVGDVDADPTAIKIRIIHAINGGVSFLLCVISYKTKTTRALRLAVTHHDRLFMKMKGGGGLNASGASRHFIQVRKKETEAYVNNGAISLKRLYIIDHKIRGGESSESGT
jgi:hypothetical protein